MNAPRKIEHADYIPTVRALMPPNDDPADLAARCAILYIRDCATATKRFCCEEAYPLLEHVERLATQHAFDFLPPARLVEIKEALKQTVAAAAAFELIFNTPADARKRAGV